LEKLSWCLQFTCSIDEFYSPAELQSAGELPESGSMKTRRFTFRAMSGFILLLRVCRCTGGDLGGVSELPPDRDKLWFTELKDWIRRS